MSSNRNLELLHSQGSHKRDRETAYGWRKYLQCGQQEGLISKLSSYNSLSKKPTAQSKKWAEDLYRHFSREQTGGQQAQLLKTPSTGNQLREKMLNIASLLEKCKSKPHISHLLGK